ncbi:putative transmembrane protein [Toxoplasma gondii GAB2-2007-GAL-DOM2]|uniref:Transmembrane protein n=7 Tax=Toxoplasma gondii TaxID=5811 RepID=S7V269_TOXGG|nr:hypothetical protein TGGT1_231180 [Toxoplasma gondii GT1]KAF4641741.1 hypothetical protein TGRH88_075520 [Toxoplasma gondii]KFG48487.1 putative transmembrane protein [Toxoplasma gondii GAB2-2007-GAL-DOM2]KFG51001.1 putative transmembrane protein [Toxoplasma gondii p89]KFG55415.1 putative transmembrane protein [Toxoplasma gondii FOU]PUA92756.1 putative transmembrane protein [Toxoplasma gondii TgCATBr9]RQX75888.1 putative transmembrane protein [Toxoplasma gondii CAST]
MRLPTRHAKQNGSGPPVSRLLFGWRCLLMSSKACFVALAVVCALSAVAEEAPPRRIVPPTETTENTQLESYRLPSTWKGFRGQPDFSLPPSATETLRTSSRFRHRHRAVRDTDGNSPDGVPRDEADKDQFSMFVEASDATQNSRKKSLSGRRSRDGTPRALHSPWFPVNRPELNRQTVPQNDEAVRHIASQRQTLLWSAAEAGLQKRSASVTDKIPPLAMNLLQPAEALGVEQSQVGSRPGVAEAAAPKGETGEASFFPPSDTTEAAMESQNHGAGAARWVSEPNFSPRASRRSSLWSSSDPRQTVGAVLVSLALFAVVARAVRKRQEEALQAKSGGAPSQGVQGLKRQFFAVLAETAGIVHRVVGSGGKGAATASKKGPPAGTEQRARDADTELLVHMLQNPKQLLILVFVFLSSMLFPFETRFAVVMGAASRGLKYRLNRVTGDAVSDLTKSALLFLSGTDVRLICASQLIAIVLRRCFLRAALFQPDNVLQPD